MSREQSPADGAPEGAKPAHSTAEIPYTTQRDAIANYCWFIDPAKALCLRLAGTPDADRPLAGMCDSARCPQATHHPCHRPVWAESRQTAKVFIGSLSRRQKSERARLEVSVARAEWVLAEIDQAAAAGAVGKDAI